MEGILEFLLRYPLLIGLIGSGICLLMGDTPPSLTGAFLSIGCGLGRFS